MASCNFMTVVSFYDNVMSFSFVIPDGEDDCSSFSFKQICYYVSAAQYRPTGGEFFPPDIDPQYCTHMIYHQALINDECNLDRYDWNDYEL